MGSSNLRPTVRGLALLYHRKSSAHHVTTRAISLSLNLPRSIHPFAMTVTVMINKAKRANRQRKQQMTVH
jgi:hypothetical protein